MHLDDILVFSKSELEHEHHLRVVLELLRTEKLCAEKCSFCASSVECIGQVMSACDGVHVDPKKIEGIDEWPLPKSPTYTEVWSYIGLGNNYFFKRFIQGYSKLFQGGDSEVQGWPTHSQVC